VGSTLHGMERQRLRPAMTAREVAFLILAVASLVIAGIVYRGPHPSTAARVATIVMALVAVGFILASAGSILRRVRAQARGSAN
jgi:hypothetical protein